MVISYFGENCFRLQSGELSLLVDPANNRLKADVTLRTSTPADFFVSYDAAIPQTDILFPGEYEIKGIEILGMPVEQEAGGKFIRTVYVLDWEEMKLGIMPQSSKLPDGNVLEKLSELDILFLPISGDGSLSPDAAAKLVRQLEPAVVIPSYLKSASEFLKATGQKAEAQEKFVFKKKDLAGKKNQVVILEPKT